jgi:L-2,4-diaminobutyric acid acetyltransferase
VDWRCVIQIRTPSVADGAAIWELVRGAGSLDVNSPYAYLLFSEYFASSCAVAYDGEVLAGAIVGFRPPQRPEALFVWQIGVEPSYRRQNLGRRMLAWLLEANDGFGARYLEATVTPDNEPSLRLFRGFAHQVGSECMETTLFPSDLFPRCVERHEPEWLLRIGPVATGALRQLIAERPMAGVRTQ